MNDQQNINQLPKEWKWEKLGDIAEITSSRRIFQEEYVNEGIPFFRTKEIKELNEGREISVELFITNQKYNDIKSKNEIPKIGDILLSAVGTIGVSYIIKDDKPFYFKDGNLVWIRKLNGVISKYLHFHFAHFIRFKQEITTSGSAYNALTIIKLKAFEIPLPPKSTQEAIVSKIEELFSELDKGIENLRLAQQQLKTYRQSVLKWAFEGKLTNVVVKDGELPKGWKWRRLGDVCDKIQDGSHFSPQVQYDEPGKNRFKYITAKNIRNDYMDFRKVTYVDRDFHDSIYGRCNPEFGDVLLTKDGINTGEVTLNTLHEPFSLLSSVCIFKTKKNDLRSEFLKYFIQSPFGSKAILDSMTGTAIKRIVLRKIKDSGIVLPPIDEQHTILQEIESRLSVADKMEDSITQSLQQAEALRQSILKKAFDGKLI